MTTNNTQIKNMNDFVKEFLNEDLRDTWYSDENQSELAKILGTKKTKTTKKAKKAKDPNKPKRGKSAYIFFCQDKRSEIKEDYPDMDPRQITSKLGEEWNAIKDDESATKKYVKLAAEDKQRYEEETKSYESSSDLEEEIKEKLIPTAKKARIPSGFTIFCKKYRKEYKEKYPNLKPQDITKILSTTWKDLSKEDQAEYKNKK